jgi:hypothetical protein
MLQQQQQLLQQQQSKNGGPQFVKKGRLGVDEVQN